jgi:hypothetical protein
MRFRPSDRFEYCELPVAYDDDDNVADNVANDVKSRSGRRQAHMISSLPMQSSAFLTPSMPTHKASGDPLRASVSHLLSRAYALPCSAAAQAFSQLVQPTSRFQLALDALLPLLSNSSEVSTISQTVQ